MVKPSELSVTFDAECSAQAQRLEAHIDEELRKRYSGKGTAIVIDLPSGYRAHVVKHVLDRAVAAGWRVEQGDDQREGAWLKFSH